MEITQKRLQSLTARLVKTVTLIQEFNEAIREYLRNWFAENVVENRKPKNPVYYIPHQAVIRQDSQTTKLRVVFGASSSAEECSSLNGTLCSGPNLNPDLTDFLIKFRTQNVAIVANIEKPLLQVTLKEEDRNALRFLWYETTPQPGQPLPLEVTWRMTRVPFGATWGQR